MTVLSKLKKLNIEYFNKMRYIIYYKKMQIDSNVIFLEAQNGRNINGNIYYLTQELNQNELYRNYHIFLAVQKKSFLKTKEFLEKKKMTHICLIKTGTRKYYQLLASAKYLMTDTSFTPAFIKKEGQVILNTWHGTPLKTLGKKVNNDFYDLGNIQKNFVIADYLLYPNEYMMKHMIEDYMLENICHAKVILEGYPRNSVFFNKELQNKIRKEQSLQEKEIFVYMPTWRGSVSQIEDEQQQNLIKEYLKQIDENLKQNQILYVNLHPFVGENIHYEEYKNIKKFPTEYETYEFLSIADVLITDYSSVFYDFANTKKKIILFTYDEEEYFKDRGLYIDLNELPFKKVSTIQELIVEMNLPKQYNDEQFLHTYCQYDNLNAAKKLCACVLLEKNEEIQYRDIPTNGKENVLIYGGNLAANGITTSLLNLMNCIDTNKRNYFLTYDTITVVPNKEVLKKLPPKVNYIPIKGRMNLNFCKKIMLILYRCKLISDKKYIKYMQKEYEYEFKRNYHNTHFSTVIQFNGYNFRKIMLYASCKNSNKVIYVHNDMYREATEKKNVSLEMLKYAYKVYDKVALVTKDLLEPTNQIYDIENKYGIAHNIINYQRVIEEAKKEVSFDQETKCNLELEKLKMILEQKNNKKFITIGRFSKEKGHERLINAFEKLYQKDKSIYLIIIGGYGKEYETTLKRAQNTLCKDHIIIIKYVTNPYSILKKCDYFILPSFYEGFGLVITEANILKKPVVCTDIIGPRNFMKENEGILIENSEEGVYKGLELLLQNKVEIMNIDYEKYNAEAVEEFEKLVEAR